MSRIKGKYVVQEELDHARIQNRGTYTHADIDAFINTYSGSALPPDVVDFTYSIPDRRQLVIFQRMTIAAGGKLNVQGRLVIL